MEAHQRVPPVLLALDDPMDQFKDVEGGDINIYKINIYISYK